MTHTKGSEQITNRKQCKNIDAHFGKWYWHLLQTEETFMHFVEEIL